ncbi:hypothetical protein NM688_g7595 [Phlebia brevispora]|uniref:Uncharacterized protein n=1 Tax=Phlebia brevispora TaxID=194682 RepID=A0ACC1S3D1_9APHY|nr:hypothetical protein NM688_g7595 [Phlebia brevispora]
MNSSSEEQPTREGRLCQNYECENTATQRCSACKKAWYCGGRCQKENWAVHIFDCKHNAPMRSAHHLIRACTRDLMPTDPQTLEDYGFARLNDSQDMSMLLGLYQGFCMIHWQGGGLEARTLDKWLREGSLVQRIKDTFEPVPLQNRGAYYPWFLENQWVLDGSPIPSQNTAEALVDRMEKALWDVLGHARKAQFPTWPMEKKICVQLYRILLSDFHPAPINPSEEYIGFGFCVARDMFTEMVIARLYRALIASCSFEEFCDAYEASSLIPLMESKGVISTRSSLPRHFEHVMRSRRMHESVWDLKQYLYGEDSVALIPSVRCDYGFMNCKQPAELDELTVVYKFAFDHKDFDEMELHDSCIRGKILEYIGKFQKLSKKKKQKLARLMKNPYPLPQLHTLSLSA